MKKWKIHATKDSMVHVDIKSDNYSRDNAGLIILDLLLAQGNLGVADVAKHIEGQLPEPPEGLK